MNWWNSWGFDVWLGALFTITIVTTVTTVANAILWAEYRDRETSRNLFVTTGVLLFAWAWPLMLVALIGWVFMNAWKDFRR